ncbi:MAG: phage tail protein [Clostridiales bacterium]|nr:phage tail protein [Clostridiales bacterium]
MDSNENKVHYDLTNVYVAPLTVDLEAGTVSFGAPKRLPGAISMDLAAQGEQTKLRADAVDYYVTNNNNGYSGDLNVAMVPDWFRQEYLGDTISTTDKVLVENAQAEPKPFAMLYEFLGDKSRRRHCLYNVTASRPNIKGENKDNQKEADTESMTMTALPLPNGNVKASTTAETPKTVYDNWTKSVWEKDSSETES